MNTNALKALIAGKIETLQEGLQEDIDLAATTIAADISVAYHYGDQESAQESIEQLELLGEIQRLRLNNAATAALRETLTFAVGVLFTSIA